MMIGWGRGHIHPIYSLVGKHQPPKFYNIEVDIGSIEDWLECVEEAIKLFKITDNENI